MSIGVNDIVAFSRARTNLSELVIAVESGAEKIITKNGEPSVAIVSAAHLAHYHRLERANIQMQLLEEMRKGLADVRAGRTKNAREGLADLIAKRACG